MKVTVIEAEREKRKKRVAAYARVSTDKAEQEESYETQVNYYEKLIKANPDWEYVGIYADKGISGTSAKKRPEFMRMIEDGENKKIDIVLVKSISRFSRNCVDAQVFVKRLKEAGVEVKFEREGISSFDPSAEMIFNILAAVAQEESRSLSSAIRWRLEKDAENGICVMGTHKVLGFDIEKGKYTPNQDAWIIKQIYEDYLSGMTTTEISHHTYELGARGIRSGKKLDEGSIWRILQNEIYVGDKLIQKQAPISYLTKKPDPSISYNSYYVTNHHEAIIARECWDAVQSLIKERRESGEYKSGAGRNKHYLTGRIICENCGELFRPIPITLLGSKVEVWKCKNRIKGKGCKAPYIIEETLFKEIFKQMGREWTGEYCEEDFEKLEKAIVAKDGTVKCYFK